MHCIQQWFPKIYPSISMSKFHMQLTSCCNSKIAWKFTFNWKKKVTCLTTQLNIQMIFEQLIFFKPLINIYVYLKKRCWFDAATCTYIIEWVLTSEAKLKKKFCGYLIAYSFYIFATKATSRVNQSFSIWCIF